MVEKVETQGGFYALKAGAGTEHTVLIVGSVGSGKSILINSWASALKHFSKYKVIYITEKNNSPMENAFCGIETNNEQQLRLLANDWMIDDRLPKREEIEIYHPFTFDFPSTNVPAPLNLFTFSIKDIYTIALSSLLSRSIDSPTTLLCEDVIKELNNEDNIYSFVFKTFEKSIAEEENVKNINASRSKQGMAAPVESYGSKRDFEQIRKIFSRFNQHFFIQEDKCELNLTEKKIKEIIDNKEKTTFFTLWKIEDSRLRYFIYIQLLLMIDKVVREKKKYPLLIILEEIKILLPKTSSSDIEETLIRTLRELMSGMRSTGTTFIASTQSYFETNKDFRGTINDVILMKLNTEDLRQFVQSYPISLENLKILGSLKSGRIILFNDLMKLDKDETVPVYRAFYVPYAHREKDRGTDSFMAYWKYRYPDEIVNYRSLIKEMQRKQDLMFEKQLEIQEEYIQRIVKKRKPKQEEKEEEIGIEGMKELPKLKEKKEKRKRKKESVVMQDESNLVQEIKEDKSVLSIEDEERKCYEAAIATPDASWEDRKILIENRSAQDIEKKALNYAIKVKNYKFIKSCCSRDLIEEYYPELINEL